MKKQIGLALAIGGLALTAATQASYIIDDFSVDTDLITAPGSKTSPLGSSSDFSQTRVLSIIENPEGPTDASVIVFGGGLGISTGVGVQSDTTSEYSNGPGFDFSGTETGGGSIFDAFVFELNSIDQGGIDMTLTVDGVSSTQFVNTPGDIIFAHSLFGDVSDVNAITLFVHNNLEVDATIDSFGSFGSRATSVPEPAPLALLAAGFVGIALGRRRKAKK